MEIDNYYLEMIPPSNLNSEYADGNLSAEFGFSLTHNQISCEFFSSSQQLILQWFDSLRDFCILKNYKEEFQQIKLFGEGNFAKVEFLILMKQVYSIRNIVSKKEFAVKSFQKSKFQLLEADKVDKSIYFPRRCP